MPYFATLLKTIGSVSALCHLCGRYHRHQYAICKPCSELLTRLGPACRHCAMPLPDTFPLICGACCMKLPKIDEVITAYRFIEPLRSLIHAFKYESALYLSSFLVSLMLEAIDEHYVTECLMPVPLHPARLRQRGFNQAAILALKLSSQLKIPCDLFGCSKIAATPSQAGLSAQQRHINLKEAFHAKHVPYLKVTLIDDLYTTGATANELAATLKKQGVQKVDIWCCARACQ